MALRARHARLLARHPAVHSGEHGVSHFLRPAAGAGARGARAGASGRVGSRGQRQGRGRPGHSWAGGQQGEGAGGKGRARAFRCMAGSRQGAEVAGPWAASSRAAWWRGEAVAARACIPALSGASPDRCCVQIGLDCAVPSSRGAQPLGPPNHSPPTIIPPSPHTQQLYLHIRYTTHSLAPITTHTHHHHHHHIPSPPPPSLPPTHTTAAHHGVHLALLLQQQLALRADGTDDRQLHGPARTAQHSACSQHCRRSK